MFAGTLCRRLPFVAGADTGQGASETDAHDDYSNRIKEQLTGMGIRADCDLRNEKTGFKIREGTLEKIPYLLIIGDREVKEETVSVRSRKNGDEGSLPLSEI